MNLKKRIVIFSIQLETFKPSVEEYKKLERQLTFNNIEFGKVTGCFKGKLEDSYACIADTDEKLRFIKYISNEYLQESILIINEDQKAFLYDCVTSVQKYIGNWTFISALEAQSLDNWTMDKEYNYFTCK